MVATAFWFALGIGIGVALACLCRSAKVVELERQIKTKCDGCDYYQKYIAAKADCKAMEEEITAMRRSYDYIRRVNKGLTRLANARA